MSAEIVRARFDGDTLEGIRRDDHVWGSVRRVCDALGIDSATQQTKRKSYRWACVGIIPTRDKGELGSATRTENGEVLRGPAVRRIDKGGATCAVEALGRIQ